MRRLGFKEHFRVGYEEWLEKGTQVFFNTGVGNYSLALMVYEVRTVVKRSGYPGEYS